MAVNALGGFVRSALDSADVGGAFRAAPGEVLVQNGLGVLDPDDVDFVLALASTSPLFTVEEARDVAALRHDVAHSGGAEAVARGGLDVAAVVGGLVGAGVVLGRDWPNALLGDADSGQVRSLVGDFVQVAGVGQAGVVAGSLLGAGVGAGAQPGPESAVLLGALGAGEDAATAASLVGGLLGAALGFGGAVDGSFDVDRVLAALGQVGAHGIDVAALLPAPGTVGEQLLHGTVGPLDVAAVVGGADTQFLSSLLGAAVGVGVGLGGALDPAVEPFLESAFAAGGMLGDGGFDTSSLVSGLLVVGAQAGEGGDPSDPGGLGLDAMVRAVLPEGQSAVGVASLLAPPSADVDVWHVEEALPGAAYGADMWQGSLDVLAAAPPADPVAVDGLDFAAALDTAAVALSGGGADGHPVAAAEPGAFAEPGDVTGGEVFGVHDHLPALFDESPLDGAPVAGGLDWDTTLGSVFDPHGAVPAFDMDAPGALFGSQGDPFGLDGVVDAAPPLPDFDGDLFDS